MEKNRLCCLGAQQSQDFEANNTQSVILQIEIWDTERLNDMSLNTELIGRNICPRIQMISSIPILYSLLHPVASTRIRIQEL